MASPLKTPAPRLRVSLTDGHGYPVTPRTLARWLERAAPRRVRGTVTIALVTDREIRRLNGRHLGHDEVTDVLSFPGADRGHQGQKGNIKGKSPSIGDLLHLGDVAIAIGRASRQAREQGHAVSTELRVLALHGLLHLLGYDHERDRGEMRRLESRLRKRAGLPDGLISRAAGRRISR